MKTKITFVLLLLATITYNVSAITVIIKGGTKNLTYKRVFSNDKRIECTGSGPNACPVGWVNISGPVKREIPVQQIVDWVNVELEAGNDKGETNFAEEVPVRWHMLDEENVQIDIQDYGVSGLENHEKDKK